MLGIDVESIAPWRGFAADSFDVANVNGTILVESAAEQDVRLVLPFPTESSSAQVRVVSTDKITRFRKERGGSRQFVELLRALGEVEPGEEPLLSEIVQATRHFRVADIHLPAGQQVLRFHARQKLLPAEGDPKRYQVVFFAPLAGFILAPGGQSSISVTVAFPPAYAASGMQIEQPIITPLPGQPAPEPQAFGPTPIAERPIYGWLWRNDPKITIPYRYA